MKKAVTAAVAALAVAGTLAASVTDAEAQRRRGGAVAAGVIGGLAAGAIIGGAIANSRPAYAAPPPAYYYGPGPVYVEPDCRVVRERYWDPYRGVWRTRRVEVC